MWCEGQEVTEGANVNMSENWFHFPEDHDVVCGTGLIRNDSHKANLR